MGFKGTVDPEFHMSLTMDIVLGLYITTDRTDVARKCKKKLVELRGQLRELFKGAHLSFNPISMEESFFLYGKTDASTTDPYALILD